jgi:hypothetical protein
MPHNIEVLTIDALLRKEFPPADTMLGGGLLDRAGALLISGPQKIGKSLFATQLALSLAGRQPFLGFPVGAHDYRVLIIQAEVSQRRMKDRFLRQVRAFPEAAQARVLNACVYSSIKLDNDEGVGIVHDLVDEHKPDLVFVDPLANFHIGDENVAQDMSRVTTVLDGIRALDVGVSLVHHHGKGSSNNKNVGHKTRGSTVLPGWYDSHLSLEWDEYQRSVKLRFDLRHDEVPEDKVLRLNPETLLFEVQADEASQITLVVGAIRDLGQSDSEAVGAYCRKTRQWANDWLNRAAEAGRLVRFNQGRTVAYAIPGTFTETRVNVGRESVVVTTNTGAGPVQFQREGEVIPFPIGPPAA